MTTGIEWTDETWNPLVGCSRVSPGCANCYAIGVVNRAMSPQHVGLTQRTLLGPDWTGEVREVPHKLDEPLRWTRPRRVFVNSLSDLFHPQVDEAYIERVFDVMVRCPRHTFQVLTKRPRRMAGLLTTRDATPEEVDAGHELGIYPGMWDRVPAPFNQPAPNVWLGVSIESNREAYRADQLRATPAAVRWISAEPLLGPLDELNLEGIDWLVAGGESGPGARPVHPEWIRDLRDRCQAAGVAFFFKQWGAWGPAACHTLRPHVDTRRPHYVTIDGRLFEPGHRLGPDHMMQPVAIHRWGKGRAGRTLDGRTWDDYPTTPVAAA